MDHELLRLECYKVASAEGLSADDAFVRAEQIFNFLLQRDLDAKYVEPKRIVAGMSNAQVTVRGVGNDQNFKDYIAKNEKSGE